jgi:hypothetical protein
MRVVWRITGGERKAGSSLISYMRQRCTCTGLAFGLSHLGEDVTRPDILLQVKCTGGLEFL